MGERWPLHPMPALSTPASSAPALPLVARLLDARTLEAAAKVLVTTVAAEHGLSRVSLGLRDGPRTRWLAGTGGEAADARGEAADRVLAAIDEALEQGLALAWPLPADEPAADLIRFDLRALQQPLGGAVAVLPLGRDGEPLGGLCLERADGRPFGAAELARLSQVLALVAPALRWMQAAERPWTRRAREAARQAIERLRQPDRRLRRRGLAAGALALALLALAPLPHEVGGRARIEGAEQRLLVAPGDGFVKTAPVRPGDSVQRGQLLLELEDATLRLEREREASLLSQHETAYASAMARSDRVGAATAIARVAEAGAELALVDERLQRGRILAPFDAVVIAGDLSQSIGAPVRQGDKLLTLATTGRQRVIVEVDEVDIARVLPGQPGSLALSALPWQREDLVVERVAPQARAVDGRNVFEVEARLVDPAAGLRPGLLGRAELTVGQRPLLWAWAGHAWARARVLWWRWLE